MVLRILICVTTWLNSWQHNLAWRELPMLHHCPASFLEKVWLVKRQQSYTILNLDTFSLQVVLAVSREHEVVLGSLSISIRQRSFQCKEASILWTAKCSFVFVFTWNRARYHSSCMRVGWHPPACTQINPNVSFPFRNCLATFLYIDTLQWTWLAIFFFKEMASSLKTLRYLMFLVSCLRSLPGPARLNLVVAR